MLPDIALRKEGNSVIVEVSGDGRTWVEVIREHEASRFSHSISGHVAAARIRSETGQRPHHCVLCCHSCRKDALRPWRRWRAGIGRGR